MEPRNRSQDAFLADAQGVSGCARLLLNEAGTIPTDVGLNMYQRKKWLCLFRL